MVGVSEVISLIRPGNDASARVAEKVGLAYDRDGVVAGTEFAIYRKELV